ncbi:MAG: hypothetical protein QM817_12160 [Archangium sp.]
MSLFSACPGPAAVDCRVGADCASGICLRDGTCAPVQSDAGSGGGGGTTGGGTGGGVTGGGTTGGGGATGGGSTTGGGGAMGGGTGAGDAGMMGCLPNQDGTIERSEVFFQPGLRATFRTSGAATFDTRGDGGVFWDFTGALSGDTGRLVETKPITGQWFEAEYPDAGYATELGQGTDLLGVFSATSDALYLHGVVSSTDGTTSTRLKYTPWVKVLQFPLTNGAQWTTNSNVTGRYNGFIIGFNLPRQDEEYTMAVDRAGTAVTPFAAFPVLRVRTTMVRSLNFVPSITIRSYNWNTECFGTVATVTSQNNETSAEFTSAAEVRRLSP